MSPRAKLFILALFIVLLLNVLLHWTGIQFGIGLGRFSFVIITTVLLYAVLTRIAEKLRLDQAMILTVWTFSVTLIQSSAHAISSRHSAKNNSSNSER
ncbi:MAG: hypothetical protein NWE78_02735 [Candidatus Bathyarchaeota archaeon]|nr:hypothetical protein [Candidatus Bathyarchaeota archaeon]